MQTETGTDNRVFNVSVIDGRNPHVNAGISFTRKPTADFLHLALAKRATSWMSVGAHAKRFSIRSRPGESAPEKGGSGYDGGASVSFAVPPSFLANFTQIGITLDNATGRGERLNGLTDPRQIGIGTKTNFNDILILYGDFIETYPNTTGAYGSLAGAAELVLGKEFFARAGLFGPRQKGWSLGGGWVGPKIGVSYGYQSQRQLASRNFEHAVTLDLFM